MKPIAYRSIYIAMSFALTLTACGPQSSTSDTSASAPKGAEDSCRSNRYTHLIGRPIDMPGMPEETGTLRHIYPDSQVTMDHRPERANFQINDEGRVSAVTCG